MKALPQPSDGQPPRGSDQPTDDAPPGRLPARELSAEVRCGDLCGVAPTEAERQRAVELFRALGHPGRFLVLDCLSRAEGLTVSELLAIVGGEQSALSHQLRVLKEARLVRSHRSGRHVVYALFDRHVGHVIADALEHVREEGAAV